MQPMQAMRCVRCIQGDAAYATDAAPISAMQGMPSAIIVRPTHHTTQLGLAPGRVASRS